MVIYKYAIPPDTDTPYAINGNLGNILCAKEQDGTIVVYVETDESFRMSRIYIYLRWTGWSFKDYPHMHYIDTVDIGGLVYHVYYTGEYRLG